MGEEGCVDGGYRQHKQIGKDWKEELCGGGYMVTYFVVASPLFVDVY